MRRASAVFFVLGPGLELGLGPWLLTRWEVGEALPGGPVRVAGAFLVAAGLAVLVHAYLRFADDGRGTPAGVVAPERLVATGIYRRVRNPMYVATAAALVGEALVLRRPVLLLAAGAYLIAFAIFVRVYEERVLAQRFGATYAAYRREVPGWLPRLRPR